MRVTASKVGLLSSCQWWARDEAEWTRTTSEAAERGTRMHRAIAAYVVSGERAEVEDDIRAEYEHACDWVDAYGRGLLSAEVAFAWDPASDTSEVLPQSGERDYSKGGGRLCGTADIVSVSRATRAGYIGDWKSGDGSGAGPQLRALALMLARSEGLESVTVEALEVRPSGVTAVARETLDAFELALVAGELAELIAAIPDSRPRPGSHCGDAYCSARLSCPMGRDAIASVEQVIPADALVRAPGWKITDPVRTPEQAILTVDVLRLMSAWIDAKKDEIKSKVPVDGWRTADGRVLRETKATVEALDKHKAVALCKQLGATDEQIGSLYYTFEKSNGLRVSGGATRPRAKRTRAA